MFGFDLEGIDGLKDELDRRLRTVEERARKLVADYGQHLHDLTFQLSPYDALELYDDFHMREHIDVQTYEEGSVFGFETGWRAEEFRAEGFAPYYLFQEFGTVLMPAQPSLTPAWADLRPSFLSDAADLLNVMAKG